MTKSVRRFTLKDLNKFLTIYKDNTNTNRCFVSTMVNDIFQSRTIVIPQQPPANYSEMLHQI